MNKQHIISEIKRTALSNDGKPLGVARFGQVTGIKECDWLGKYWARWSDAVEEAGSAPNQMTGAHSDDDLLKPLIQFIRGLGYFPTKYEQRLRRKADKSYPPSDCIGRRWGRKSQVAARVIEYCTTHNDYENVIRICAPIASTVKKIPENTKEQKKAMSTY